MKSASWKILSPTLLMVMVLVLGMPLFGQAPEDAGGDLPEVLEAAVADVDWKKGEILLKFPLGPGEPLRWKSPDGAGGNLPKIEIREKEVEIRTRVSQLLPLLVPGTRSFLLEGGAKSYRVDLPAVDIRAYYYYYVANPKDNDGLDFSWTVQNLLPGYRLWMSRQEDFESQPGPMVELKSEPGPEGYVQGVEPNKGGWKVNIVLPPAASEDAKKSYLFLFTNPDGSQSRTIRLQRDGNTIVGEVQSISRRLPAPVAETVVVPRVDLHPIEEAIEKTTSSGLVPVLVDLQTGLEVPIKQADPRALVYRQGLIPEEPAFKGHLLLLSINEPNLKSIPPLPGKWIKNLGAIDTEGQVGLVQPSRRLVVFGPGGAGLGLLGRQNKKPIPPDEDALSVPEKTNDLAIIPIHPDKGINLLPDTKPEQQVPVNLLKSFLDEMEKNQGQYPGPLGDFILDAEKLINKNLKEMEDGQSPLDQLPGQDVLDLALKDLDIPLNQDEKDDLLQSLDESPLGGPIPGPLLNKPKGDLARQLIRWILEELLWRNKLNPNQFITPGQGPNGNLLGLLTKPGTNPNLNNLGILPLNPNNSNKPQEKEPNIPMGPLKVVESELPSKVRVPALNGQTALKASELLKEVGLKYAFDGKLLKGDKIVDTRPATPGWAPPDSSIHLTIHRKVPDVEGMTLKEAREKLESFDFRLGPKAQKGQLADKVKKQLPEAGTFLARNSVVDLDLTQKPKEVEVPSFKGLLLAAAESKAAGVKLKIRAKSLENIGTRFAQTNEKPGQVLVDSQNPLASKKVVEGTTVEVVLVRLIPQVVKLKLPDLTNRTLEDARKLAEGVGAKLKDSLPGEGYPTRPETNPNLVNKLIVERQAIPPGTEIEKGTVVVVQLVRLVAVTPKVNVPSFLELALDEAVALGMRYGLKVVRVSKQEVSAKETDQTNLVGRVVVSYQNPRVGTVVEKGSTVTVDLIRYVARGVVVPPLKGLTLEAATSECKKLPLQVRQLTIRVIPTLNPSLVGKVLISGQNPNPGQRVPPNSVVEVTLDRYIPQVVKVRVPNLQYYDFEVAAAETNKLGLKIHNQSGEVFPTQPTDDARLIGRLLIGRQSPAAGTEVEKGSTVEILLVRFVSRGIRVPNFHERTLEAAQALANQAGLEMRYTIIKRKTQNNNLVGQTLVTNQSIPANTMVPKGTQILLTLEQFVPAVVLVQVPNFLRMEAAQARAAAAHAGVIVNIPSEGAVRPTDNPELVNRVFVVGQNLPAGQQVPKGTQINLEIVQLVAAGARVPNLKGKSVEDAKIMANQANLQLQIVSSSVRFAAPGERPRQYMEHQNPPPGATAQPGSAIRVSVVQVRAPNRY